MTSSAQLEREAERTRAQFAETLDELRERITPGQLVDQAVDYAKDSGGGMFVRNLGRQVTANPLPVALIGAGVAWLMLANGRAAASSGPREAAIDRARRRAIDAAARMGDTAQEASGRAGESARSAAESVSSLYASAKAGASATAARASESAQQASGASSQSARSATETASSLFESAKSGASDAYARVGDVAARTASGAYQQLGDSASRASSAMTESVSGLGQRTADAGRDFLQFCRSQPLFLGGLGLAVGAIIGNLIPPSDTEDRLMGGTSDQMKDQVRDFAEDQAERAKSAATSAAAAAAQVGQAALEEGEAEFQFQAPAAHPEVPAETSLVPEAEQDSEQHSLDEPAEPHR